ncbi:hypothetical protein VTN77DRAFT_3919 [Rasamsonia byssochlamydoides]|uniref:uncharacterized protein n=1 Tax=Rasamsonia byssochlamydoides TaxID=89139 RepID=UPI003743E302
MEASHAPVPNKAPVFFIVTSILVAIAFSLVVYRFVYGWTMRKALSGDDIVIGLSMTTQIITTLIGDMAVHYGFGRHKQDVDRSGGNLILALKYFWLFQVFYKLVLCLTKLSFIVFYLRIFPSKGFHHICFLTMAVIVTGVIGFVFATIFQCVPIAGSWDKNIHSHCIDNSWFRWWWAGYNTGTDLWVFLMPMPLLAQLQLDLVRKIGVMLMFALGLFVCITSVIRMRALVESTTTTDPTWGSFDALLWSAIEASCGIICACLPFLKHPIKYIFPKLFSSLGGSRHSRSRPTYKLSALSSRGGGTRRATGQWTNLENASIRSHEPIAPNQIMMKTDISLKTDYVDPDELHHQTIPGV